MKMFTDDILRKVTVIATILLVTMFCGSAALAATVSSCAAGSFGPTPTNTVFPTDCTGMDTGTLEAWMSAPFTYTTTSGTNSGFIYSAVYLDAGTLDFYYQVVSDPSSTTAIARLTATDFAGFTTNSAFWTNGSALTGTGFLDGTVGLSPETSDSNFGGSVIGFSFYPPTGPPQEIAPGDVSDVVIISTNATLFTAGNASVIDGGTDTVAAFQPTTGVPEPASLGLLGLGLIALAGLRRRIRG